MSIDVQIWLWAIDNYHIDEATTSLFLGLHVSDQFQIPHADLLAFVELLATRTNLPKNVLHLRRYFCAYFGTWTRAGQVNLNWIFWPGREENHTLSGKVVCRVMDMHVVLWSGSGESEIEECESLDPQENSLL
jgi:hypothetical protein